MRYAWTVVVLLCASPAWTAGDPFSGFGMLSLSCGAYLNDISTSSEKKNVYEWWVAGFVSGTNLAKGRVTSTDVPGLTAWLKRYCDAHPLDPFMKAVIELDNELDKKQ